MILLIVLQGFLFLTLAADAPGRFERYCDGAWFYLSNAGDLPASNKLLLFFRMPMPGISAASSSPKSENPPKRESASKRAR